MCRFNAGLPNRSIVLVYERNNKYSLKGTTLNYNDHASTEINPVLRYKQHDHKTITLDFRLQYPMLEMHPRYYFCYCLLCQRQFIQELSRVHRKFEKYCSPPNSAIELLLPLVKLQRLICVYNLLSVLQISEITAFIGEQTLIPIAQRSFRHV
jgi:hypothetical protein